MKKRNYQQAILVLVVTLIAGGGDRASEFAEAANIRYSESKPAISASALPAQQLPVPGWLGFATKPTKNGRFQFPWSPTNASAQIAIFSRDWGKVNPGTPLTAVAIGGKQAVKFQGAGKQPYGCDNTPTDMATFTAPKPFSEGAVWLLPPERANAATAVPLEPLPLNQVPVNLLPASKRQASLARAWKAGASTIVLQKQSTYKAKLTLAVNSKEVFSTEAEKYFFSGEKNKKPLDLSQPQEPGIPLPVGVFQFSGLTTPITVLWVPGYEGHSFQAIAPNQGKVQRIDVASVYYCAY